MSINQTAPSVGLRASSGGQVVTRVPGAVETDRVRFARRRRIKDNLLRWGTPVLVLSLWQLTTALGVLDEQFWPAPASVFAKAWETIQSGLLPEHLGVTVQRLLTGYLAGAIAGVALGLIFGTVRSIRVALEPIISALYTVPKLALFPFMLLVFGLGPAPKIIMTALAVFFITCISTSAAVLGVSDAMHEPIRSFGATRMQTFRHLIVPAVLPEIFVALRLGSGTAVLVLIAIEMIQGSDGLGFVIWSSWQVFDTERMYVGIIVAALMGVIFQMGVKAIGRLLVPWKPR
ncbi:ABC transporter permease [Acrocarpospora macrocephala]|uniref:Nitrate ABC transporter permease n=1 Tax=Acrocarpospora macrocephala TaxID=150177 RepID=A0A5M3WQQ6_9ACTN|nr:ABC transporter permease [Acrocarpospora macrocephala]GES09621.1 nitrate ABC transporter permease [Acrocarpospora macrocephala]